MNGDTLHPEVHQAEDELPSRMILAVLAGTLYLAGLLVLLAGLLLLHWEGQLRPGRHFPEARIAAPDIVQNLRQGVFALQQTGPTLNGAKRDYLDTFHWVDRPRGIVAIPIERAMDLVAAGGAP